MAAESQWEHHTKGDKSCSCWGCTSRRGRTKAKPLPAGTGRAALAAIGQDKQEVLIASAPRVTDGRSRRDTIAMYLMFQASEPGISNIEIARRLGISRNTLGATIDTAVREGWLKFDQPLERLEHELIPKVVDNLNHFLDKKDKTVTLETAKGCLFKDYQQSKGISDAPTTVLALKIETVDSEGVKVIEGHVVGTPRELEEENA